MLDEHRGQRARPRHRPELEGGVFSPTDGTADPSRAAPSVARAILKLGSSVHQNCAARGIETEGGV
ncbi:FAD-dependent oxidoreductase [Mesorhizobium atlanticum]